jgi:hypothetical protein
MTGRVLVPVDALRELERVHRPREPRVLVLEVAAAIADLPPPSSHGYGQPQLREHVPRLTQLRGVVRASGNESREAVRAWANDGTARPLAVRAALAYVLDDAEAASEVLRETRGTITPPSAAALALEVAADATLVAEAGAWLARSHARDLLERGPFVLAAYEDRPAEAGHIVLAWLDALEAEAKTATSYTRRDTNESVGKAIDLVVCVGTAEVATRVAALLGKANVREDVARFFKRFPELARDALAPLAKGRGKVRDAAVAMLKGLEPAIEKATGTARPEPPPPSAELAPAIDASSDAPSGIEVLDDPPWRSWSRSGLLVLEQPPSPVFDLPPEATAKHDREAWVAKLPSIPRNVIFSSRAAFPVAHAWLASRAERAAAETWLTTFAPIAAYGLLPYALGEPGPSRTAASRALRFVWRSFAPERGPKVLERWATDAGGDPAALVPAILAIVSADSRWDCPSSPPSWPSWLAQEALPIVRTRAGVPLGDRAKRHLVELMIVAGGAAGGGDLAQDDLNVRQARDALDGPSVGALSFHVYTQWTVLGQNARVSWPLGQIALFGGRSAAHKLAAQIRGLATDRELSRALEAIGVLARVPDESALVHLATLAETAKNERVRAEAKRLLEATATQRGVAPEELEDLLVPDLGLDDRGELTLDYGPRRVRVRLDTRLTPVLLDESGARLAQLPRVTKSDEADKAAAAVELYKALKADAEGAAKSQLRRFERAMCTERTWSTETFSSRLLAHPVLRTLVSGLVWSARRGEAVHTFRIAEDRSLAGPDDDAFELGPGDTLAIPHPLALSKELRARWGGVLGDYEIVQPFAQLARETYELSDAERAAASLDRIAGKRGEVGNVFALEQRGWQITGSRTWVVSLRRALSKASVELRFTDAIDLSRPKETPEIVAASLFVVPVGTVGQTTFASLGPIEASEVLRDLAFLV